MPYTKRGRYSKPNRYRFYKTYYKKRMYKKQGTAYKTRPVAGTTAVGLYNARASGAERKFVDAALFTKLANTVSIAGIAPTNSFCLLANGISQGTDYTQRIGRKIKMTSIYWRLAMRQIQANTQYPQQVRVLLIYDKQPSGVAFSLSELFELGTTNVGSTGISTVGSTIKVAQVTPDTVTLTGGNPVSMPLNLNNRDRFIVISDKVYSTNPSGYNIIFAKKYKRLNTETIYQNNSAGIADIASGALWFVVLSYYGYTTTYQDMAEFELQSRVRFTDE